MGTTALIIPAAGSGSRLNRTTPKPYITLAGKPILEHTVRRFLSQDGLSEVIVATSAEYAKTARNILDGVLPGKVHLAVVEGGEERQHSIFNALKAAGDVDLVMVHDAVRPFVTPEQIRTCCRVAEEAGGAVLIPARDTIKRTDQTGSYVKRHPVNISGRPRPPRCLKKKY